MRSFQFLSEVVAGIWMELIFAAEVLAKKKKIAEMLAKNREKYLQKCWPKKKKKCEVLASSNSTSLSGLCTAYNVHSYVTHSSNPTLLGTECQVENMTVLLACCGEVEGELLHNHCSLNLCRYEEGKRTPFNWEICWPHLPRLGQSPVMMATVHHSQTTLHQ